MAGAPRYQQIAAELRAEVESGRYTDDGGRLPAETALADRFGTSVPTVRQAMSVLRAAGVVESRHGIGTFAITSPSPTGTARRLVVDLDDDASPETAAAIAAAVRLLRGVRSVRAADGSLPRSPRRGS